MLASLSPLLLFIAAARWRRMGWAVAALAVGLAVTLGLMNVVNLAHGAFAMAGGYARQIDDTVAIQATTIRLARQIWR